MTQKYAPLAVLTALWVSLSINAQTPLRSPDEFLGYPLGSRFTEHGDMVRYFGHLAAARPEQLQLDTIGTTYEGRPLIVATLSSAGNMSSLDRILSRHLSALEDQGDSGKGIVWLSYNVHGNESVSMEAAMLTAHRLLTERQDLLNELVVRIDPCLNPDGRDRYTHWFRQYSNRRVQPDRQSKEHWEDWPGGRANHYLFDLNRDWAWMTQIESVHRLAEFQRWMPHIHVDFHEQGINNPYYFAPAAEPYHEVVSDFQRSFQEEIGANHAAYFDREGWLYFTREQFDLLYPGYGDTYPMFNGAIGMTYEQAGGGAGGTAVITAAGDTLTLMDRILHHYTTGISTLEMAARNVSRLNAEFRKFFRDYPSDYSAFVVKGQPDKLEGLGRLLAAHGIRVHVGTGRSGKGMNYRSGQTSSYKEDENTWVVPTRQPKGKLAKVLLEPKTRVVDSLTYDITSWSLPHAHGLEAWAVRESLTLGAVLSPEELSQWSAQFHRLDDNPESLGYVTGWSSFKDGQWLAELLREGIALRRYTEPVRLSTGLYDRGSIAYLERDQTRADAREVFLSISRKHRQSISALSKGRAITGPDLGSSSVERVRSPRIAVLSGEPTRAYSFGEIWHFLEQQLDYPLSVLDASGVDRTDLSAYDILVLPEGSYRSFLDSDRLDALEEWVRSGGRLIAVGNAMKSLTGRKSFGLEVIEVDEENEDGDEDQLVPYSLGEREGISQEITGALFDIEVDPTHPLAYGYGTRYVVLKNSSDAFKKLSSGTVAGFGKDIEPLTGFAGARAKPSLEGSLSIGVQKLGSGELVYFVDNPLFRGFWEEGKLFMVNALFGNF